MDKDISTALGRLDRYVFRVKRAVRNGDLVVALAETAELSFEAAFAEMARDREVMDEVHDMEGGTVGDGLESSPGPG